VTDADLCEKLTRVRAVLIEASESIVEERRRLGIDKSASEVHHRVADN